MYKLILGNVQIRVYDSSIDKKEAAAAARQALSTATRQGRSLSHIDIKSGLSGLDVTTTEKLGPRTAGKSIKQSLLDGLRMAIQERLYPPLSDTAQNIWLDTDTGQEWHGSIVAASKDDLLKAFEAWAATIK